MENLKKYEAQEIESQELNEINGGVVGFIIAGIIGGYKMEAMKNGEPWYWPAFVPYE